MDMKKINTNKYKYNKKVDESGTKNYPSGAESYTSGTGSYASGMSNEGIIFNGENTRIK